MSLNNQVMAMLECLQQRAALKERYLELVRGHSDEQYAVRRQHLAKDDECEALVESVIGTLRELQSDGMTEFDLMALPEQAMGALHKLLSERGLLGLLEPAKPSDLPSLVRVFRETSFTLDCARKINQLRLACQPAYLNQVFAAQEAHILEENDAESLEVQAWRRALRTFSALKQQLLAQVAASGTDQAAVSEDDVNAEAGHANARRWLRRYDTLREQLSDMVEGLMSRNSLSYQLEDMDVHDRRALLGLIDGGLVRQLQAQPQTKPQPMAVATLADEDVEEGDEWEQ